MEKLDRCWREEFLPVSQRWYMLKDMGYWPVYQERILMLTLDWTSISSPLTTLREHPRGGTKNVRAGGQRGEL